MTWSGLALELGLPLQSAVAPAFTVSRKYLYSLKDPWAWKDISAGPGTYGCVPSFARVPLGKFER